MTTKPVLFDEALTQLAFSIYENKGVFALLLGSGLSRSAEIPTGWEITVDLIRRVAIAQDVDGQADWAEWYRQVIGEEPNYSALLEKLSSSPAERRAILHSYIELTEKDHEEGKKLPTSAHRAIAKLVRSGFIRTIITTNFDRLIEGALREIGIEPTVVASLDALQGAEPLTHSACYILKLHGDYKDSRILNTDGELSSYPPAYNNLLDRIIDEHGLVVCGWSGEWDHALRSAFLRAPNRRYTTFWATRGEPGDAAKDLIAHRDARVISISNADDFFTALEIRVETIAQTHRQNPRSTELLVSSVKRLLSRSEYRIQLDELIRQELDRTLSVLDDKSFSAQAAWSLVEFEKRINKYEAAVEALASMVGVLGKWGTGSEFKLVVDILQSLFSHSENIGSGITHYLNLRSYPAVVIFTAYGLGLVRTERWKALHDFFNAKIDRQHNAPERLVELMFLWAWPGSDSDVWTKLKGLERHKTPLSDHLLNVFSNWGQRFLGIAPNFELMFERFEILGSLAHLERYPLETLQKEIGSSAQQSRIWMPVGRASWHRSNGDKLISELQAQPLRSDLVAAGFGTGNDNFIDLFIRNFQLIADRMRW